MLCSLDYVKASQPLATSFYHCPLSPSFLLLSSIVWMHIQKFQKINHTELFLTWIYPEMTFKQLTSFAIVVVQSLSHARLFATPWNAACQASLSFSISRSLLKLMSTELLMPSNHLILRYPLLLPSVFPIISLGNVWTASLNTSQCSKMQYK